jgi:hypothetical protein
MKAKYENIFSAIFKIKFIPKFQNFCWYTIENSTVIDPPEQITSQNISTLKAYFKIVALDWHMTLTFL